jgi:hypothetical protein
MNILFISSKYISFYAEIILWLESFDQTSPMAAILERFLGNLSLSSEKN